MLNLSKSSKSIAGDSAESGEDNFYSDSDAEG